MTNGEIHPQVVIDEASEWVARIVISLATVPGDTLDPTDSAQLLTHVRRYLTPALRAAPEV